MVRRIEPDIQLDKNVKSKDQPKEVSSWENLTILKKKFLEFVFEYKKSLRAGR